MRREGRQHGMVRYRETYGDDEIHKLKKRLVNKLPTVPTTKFMTRVPAKPTNHSRFTGRWSYGCDCPLCTGCSWPINKSHGKAKGTHKHRHYADVAVNHLLVSQKLVGPANRARWVRFGQGSASWLVSQLTDFDCGELDIDCPGEIDDDYDVYCNDHVEGASHEHNELIWEKEETDQVDMGFCFVEFVTELDGEDAWCLIGEI